MDDYLGIAAVCGDEGTGKTTMALTFPRPLRHFDVDVGGYRRAIWRLPSEGIESKGYPRPIQVDKLKGIQGSPSARITIPKKVEGMKELWQQIVTDFVSACMDEKVKTVVIDSATILWGICHNSHLQELQERQLSKHRAAHPNRPFDENDYRERLQPIEYCLHPDTRVLFSDLTWQRIGEVVIGDELIGFDEEAAKAGKGSIRKFRRSIVEGISINTMPAFIICLSDGSYVIASKNHGWLTAEHFDFPSGSFFRSEWRTTAELKPGIAILHLGKPWEYDTSRDAGYLEGVYDGEGWVERYGIGFKQNLGEVLSKTEAILSGKFPYYRRHDEPDTKSAYLKIGKLAEGLRFLGSVRPKRLLQDADNLWEEKALRQLEALSVTGVYPLRATELIDIQTSTGTFIAEGLLTHNSPANDRMRTILHTARSYSKNLVLTHYPTDEYGTIPDGKGNMVEGKTGKRILDGFKETVKLVDLVVWVSIRETVNAGVKKKQPVAKITKCGLEGAGLAAVGLEIPATYDGIVNIVNLLKGTRE